MTTTRSSSAGRRLMLTQSVGGTMARQSSAAGHSAVGLLYGGGVKKHGASVASCPACAAVVFFSAWCLDAWEGEDKMELCRSGLLGTHERI